MGCNNKDSRHPQNSGPSSQLISDSSINIINSKGDFVGAGSTGIVDLLPTGYVMKYPWTGRSKVADNDCRQEMTTEAQIYKRLLGEPPEPHPRILRLVEWDEVQCTLTLEYMPGGSLREYIQKRRNQDTNGERTLPASQKLRWALQVTEAIQFLHSHGVIQADVGPHNFLLNAELTNLKICDFGGSSLDGSKAAVVASTAYRLPLPAGRRIGPATKQEDLFALGSLLYFIAMGCNPYDGLDDDEIEKRYREGRFPDLDGVLFAQAITLCWTCKTESAEMVAKALMSSLE